MKVAYVVGPYRAETHYEIKQNIRRAEAVAEQLWVLGFAAYCPHTATSFLSGLVSEEQFLEAGEEFARRADLVVAVKGWEDSEGSLREKAACEEAGRPFYRSIDALRIALTAGKETI